MNTAVIQEMDLGRPITSRREYNQLYRALDDDAKHSLCLACTDPKERQRWIVALQYHTEQLQDGNDGQQQLRKRRYHEQMCQLHRTLIQMHAFYYDFEGLPFLPDNVVSHIASYIRVTNVTSYTTVTFQGRPMWQCILRCGTLHSKYVWDKATLPRALRLRRKDAERADFLWNQVESNSLMFCPRLLQHYTFAVCKKDGKGRHKNVYPLLDAIKSLTQKFGYESVVALIQHRQNDDSHAPIHPEIFVRLFLHLKKKDCRNGLGCLAGACITATDLFQDETSKARVMCVLLLHAQETLDAQGVFSRFANQWLERSTWEQLEKRPKEHLLIAAFKGIFLYDDSNVLRRHMNIFEILQEDPLSKLLILLFFHSREFPKRCFVLLQQSTAVDLVVQRGISLPATYGARSISFTNTNFDVVCKVHLERLEYKK